MSDFITSDADSGFGIESIYVNDQSIATPTLPTTLSLFPVLAPIMSSAGQDNKIVKITNTTDMLNKYGDDVFDYKQWGQQNLNVEQVLSNGGTVYVCRLLPDDAKTAYTVCNLQMQEDLVIPVYEKDAYGSFLLDAEGNRIQKTVTHTPAATPENPTPVPVTTPVTVSGIRLRWKTAEIPTGLVNLDMEDAAEQIGEIIGEEDGWTNIPVMFVNYFANGTSGNNIGFKILNDFARDDTTDDGRRYQITMYKKKSSGAYAMTDVASQLSFSFNPAATVSLYSAELEGLQAVYSNLDSSNNAKEVELMYYSDNYTKIIEQLQTYLTADPVVTEYFDASTLNIVRDPTLVDFVYGKDKNGSAYDNIVIDATSEVTETGPTYIKHGTNGSLDTITDTAELNALKKDLLSRFFNCQIDTKVITDVLHCDAAILFDANYDLDTKFEMLNLQKNRQDIAVVFDCNRAKNLNEAIGIAKQIRAKVPAYGSEKYIIAPHSGSTVGRAVNYKLTQTYEMAGSLTSLYKIKPFTIYSGYKNQNGVVKNMIFDWVVSETTPKGEEKRLAKENRLYYAIDFGNAVSTVAPGNITNKSVYMYSNSNLYHTATSKLSEWRNGLIIGDLKRVCKLVLIKYTFDPDGAEQAMKDAKTEMVRVTGTRYPANILISINNYQTRNDQILNQCSCDIGVTFPNIIDSWKCTITSNRALVE